MGQRIPGSRQSTDFSLARLAARIRGNREWIAAFLEDAAGEIEALIRLGAIPPAPRLLDKMHHALAAICGMGPSGQTDLTAAAAIERALTEVYANLAALRDTVAGGADRERCRPETPVSSTGHRD